jgi:hypothetical protein
MTSLAEYLAGPFTTIQGWCSPLLWQAIQPIHEFQASNGMNRPIAEIGVHYGKFFIGLAKTKNADRANYAIDIFDMQEFNLDHSGKGSLERFEKYLAECGVARESVEILRTDSLAIDDGQIAQIRQKSGGFSLFSVDGCHLAEHTYIDVCTAMRLTAPEGVIMVDDYYNPSWPGVQEGVAKLYFTSVPKFVPLAFTCSKLFLAHISYHDIYLELVIEFLKKNHPETVIKKARRFGYDSITIVPDQKVGRPVA